jgi:hypothetical protein
MNRYGRGGHGGGGVNSDALLTPALDRTQLSVTSSGCFTPEISVGYEDGWPNLGTEAKRKNSALVGNRTHIYRSTSP